LDGKGIVRFDIDVLLHRYFVTPTSEVQYLMCIEVKTFAAVLTDSQRDTLGMFYRVLRNSSPVSVFSSMRMARVPLRLLGGHLLRMSHSSPDDSAWMTWDNTPITRDELVDLLLFDRDPDDPRGNQAEWLQKRDGLTCVA
jgi:hypothetical protein